METALVRIRKDQHEALTTAKSDTGGDVSIGSEVQQAVDLHLKRRQLNALVMKAHSAPTLEDARRVLKEEVAELLGIPEEYLFAD